MGKLSQEMSQLANKKHLADPITSLLLLVYFIGIPLIIYLASIELLPLWAGLLIGTFLMNLSFTAWHECSHNNFSQYKFLNTIIGVAAGAFSLYPGYFATKREHLIHHMFQGQDGKDPVYPRIQTSFLGFPWKLLLNFRMKISDPEVIAFMPLSAWQKTVDLMVYMVVVSIIFTSIMKGWFIALLFSWIIPRGLVFWMHAYYICFFPHQIAAGGYELFRVRKPSWFKRIITVDQIMHGLHHKWVYIPWHRYKQAYGIIKESKNHEDLQIL